MYAHPVEVFATNMLPMLLQPLILQMHFTVAWLWLFLGAIAVPVRGLMWWNMS